MEENPNVLESLFERAAEYGKTSFELAKLKALEKIADFVSSFIPHSVVFAIITVFILFINLGLAFWLGEILGKIYYGFFIIAGFYGIAGIIIHFFMHKWLKKITGNQFIKQVLK